LSAQGFGVIQPGVLTLIQDEGRFGSHRLGLTSGGPADPLAFHWANRLCGNTFGVSALEVNVGGLVLESHVPTRIAVCGADVPISINEKVQSPWKSHRVRPGDRVELGYASKGIIGKKRAHPRAMSTVNG